jgi:hypothetical protein
MKEHFGDCLTKWKDGVAVLDLVTGLSGPLVPAVLQKLILIKVVVLTTTQALGAVGLTTAQQILMYSVKAPFDIILFWGTYLTILVAVVTGAFAFMVPMLLIPGAMLLLSGVALAVVYLMLNGTQSFFNCLCRKKQEAEEPNSVYAESVEWITKGYRDIRRWRAPRTSMGLLQQRTGLLLARTATHRFAYLALFVMAIAPGMLFSTWWAWQAYDGRHSTKEMGAMLFEIYEFSFESWTKNIEMPSIFSLWELTDLTAEGFLSMLEELNAFEFTPPEVLLKRSRLLSSLSAPLAIAKGLITVLQKILALCLSEGKGIKTKQISAGASAEGLRLMGFTPRECVAMGCSDEQMRAAGFSISELKDYDDGKAYDDLKAAGKAYEERAAEELKL